MYIPIYYCSYFIDIILRFNQATYGINENDGPFQPVLVLSNPSSTDITIQVVDSEVSARSNLIGGGDYTPGTYIVMIPAGHTSASFDISITDDNVVENDEVFSLAIMPESLPYLVSRGNPSVAMVTIVSDDGKSSVLVKMRVTSFLIISMQ